MRGGLARYIPRSIPPLIGWLLELDLGPAQDQVSRQEIDSGGGRKREERGETEGGEREERE